MEKLFDHYWNMVGEGQDTSLIRKNKHFDELNVYLQNHVDSIAILEDKVPCKYRDWKKWDMHFPDKKVAIEYKTITAKSIQKCKYLRVEEALGSSLDVKANDADYKLGFFVLFAFNLNNERIPISVYKWRDWIVSTFGDMVQDGHYDFLCIIQTNGIGSHEVIGEYGLDQFVEGINNVEGGHQSSLERFL